MGCGGLCPGLEWACGGLAVGFGGLWWAFDRLLCESSRDESSQVDSSLESIRFDSIQEVRGPSPRFILHVSAHRSGMGWDGLGWVGMGRDGMA